MASPIKDINADKFRYIVPLFTDLRCFNLTPIRCLLGIATVIRVDKRLIPILSLVITGLVVLYFSFSMDSKSRVYHQAQQLLTNEGLRFEKAFVQGSETDIRLMQGASSLIEAAGIWDKQGNRLFPSREFAPHIYDQPIIHNLGRLESLRDLANPDAWESFDVNNNAVFYCQLYQNYVCFLVDAQQLATAVEVSKSRLVETLFARPRLVPWQVYLMAAIVAFAIASVLYRPRNKSPKTSQSTGRDDEHVFTMADMTVDTLRMRITRGDHSCDISVRDLKLLSCLHQQADQVISKDKLYNAGWGRDFIPNSRSLEQHIMTLRKKIDPQRNREVVIETVHGQGYRYPITR